VLIVEDQRRARSHGRQPYQESRAQAGSRQTKSWFAPFTDWDTSSICRKAAC